MKPIKSTIAIHTQIDTVLLELDAYATKSINSGRMVTVEWCNDAVTTTQLKSMHLWCRWCEVYLNSIDAYRVSSITGKMVPWSDGDFKQCVYKPFLRVWKGKASTKDQTTKG